ncbi:MAG: hypothetical protein AB1582_12175 [Pseudomonadota bacterium]
MSLVNVAIHAKQLAAWAAELSERGFRNALRRAIDQSARAARRITIDVIAKDIGVTKSKIAAAVPKVIATKAGDLAARWTVSKLRIGILNTQGASVSRTGGLTAQTHRLTGGGSASLHVARAFIVTTAAGGKFVAFRKGRERLPLKGVYAEHPATAMAQETGAARVTWQKEADKQLSMRLPVEVQKAFNKEGLSASTPDSGD